MNILIVQPDPATADWLKQTLAISHPTDHAVILAAPNESVLRGLAEVGAILTDAHFESADGPAWIALAKTAHPKAKLAVVSAYDLSGWETILSGETVFQIATQHEDLVTWIAAIPKLAAPSTKPHVPPQKGITPKGAASSKKKPISKSRLLILLAIVFWLFFGFTAWRFYQVIIVPGPTSTEILPTAEKLMGPGGSVRLRQMIHRWIRDIRAEADKQIGTDPAAPTTTPAEKP